MIGEKEWTPNFSSRGEIGLGPFLDVRSEIIYVRLYFESDRPYWGGRHSPRAGSPVTHLHPTRPHHRTPVGANHAKSAPRFW